MTTKTQPINALADAFGAKEFASHVLCSFIAYSGLEKPLPQAKDVPEEFYEKLSLGDGYVQKKIALDHYKVEVANAIWK